MSLAEFEGGKYLPGDNDRERDSQWLGVFGSCSFVTQTDEGLSFSWADCSLLPRDFTKDVTVDHIRCQIQEVFNEWIAEGEEDGEPPTVSCWETEYKTLGRGFDARKPLDVVLVSMNYPHPKQGKGVWVYISATAAHRDEVAITDEMGCSVIMFVTKDQWESKGPSSFMPTLLTK